MDRQFQQTHGSTARAVERRPRAHGRSLLTLQRSAGNRAVAGVVGALAVQRTRVPQNQVDALREDLDSANLPKAKRAIDELFKDKKLDSLSQLLSILKSAAPQTKNDRNLVEYVRGYLTSGEQDVVQRKMADLIRMFRKQQFGQDDTDDFRIRMFRESDEQAGQDETNVFRKEIIDDGLCGGWTVLFAQHPDWVEPVYNAVRTWVRAPGESDTEALQGFETHLRRTTTFTGVEHVVQLVRDAYQAMDVLEPGEYQNEPQWVKELNAAGTRPTSKTTARTARLDETVINVKGKNAAHVVCEELAELTSANTTLECMAHIESDFHHMAVRVQKLHPTGKTRKIRMIITVVESEVQGIKKVVSWAQAEPLLNRWLSTKEPNLREITLRTRLVELNSVAAV